MGQKLAEINGDIINKLRDISLSMAKIMSPSDIEYIEALFGIDDYKAALENDKYIVPIFLLTLEVFVGNYLHPLLMIHEISMYMSEFNFRPAILTGPSGDDLVDLQYFSDIFNLKGIYGFYKELFLSNEGRRTLDSLIEEIDDNMLKNRLRRFFTGDKH